MDRLTGSDRKVASLNIGYACLAIAVPGSDFKNCTLKNATDERLLSLIGYNLSSLEKVIDYNINNGIRLFRISSDLIPFGSSLAAEIPWQRIYAEQLSTIGNKIIRANMRVSMHPGQYTVLNSPSDTVAERAVQDLDYHAQVLECMGLGTEHKLVLHLGGVYGDKAQAASRFISRYQELDPAIKKRLVVENDDALYTARDVLEIAARVDIPVVFDNLHNLINPTGMRCTELEWIQECASTWKRGDGAQKIHYSQQHRQKRPGAHSDTINADMFLQFCRQLDGAGPDIMLEVKDKNISALKCIHCVENRAIGSLEAEWSRYKYSILERSPEIYKAIRQLLTDKKAYPAVEMYRRIDAAWGIPVSIGNAVNAAQHMWGYFKDRATGVEKNRFQQLLDGYVSGGSTLPSVKKHLMNLARKYHEEYLLNGYYFYLA